MKKIVYKLDITMRETPNDLYNVLDNNNIKYTKSSTDTSHGVAIKVDDSIADNVYNIIANCPNLAGDSWCE